MKRFLSLLLVFAATMLLVGCGNKTTNAAKTNGTIIVGMECDYQPFNWTETKATDSNVPIDNVPGAYAEGYDVQVAKTIAKELNYDLKIKAIAWDGLIPALQAGEIDMIIAGMSPTDERKTSIDFTDSYYRSTHVLLLKSDSAYASAKTLDDFAGAKTIGQLGTLYADLSEQLATNHGAVQGTNLDTVPTIVNAILQGTVDVTVLEEPVAIGICNQYGSQLTYITPTDGFEVSEEDVVVSIGVRKGYALTNDINSVLNNVLTQNVRNNLMLEATGNGE